MVSPKYNLSATISQHEEIGPANALPMSQTTHELLLSLLSLTGFELRYHATGPFAQTRGLHLEHNGENKPRPKHFRFAHQSKNPTNPQAKYNSQETLHICSAWLPPQKRRTRRLALSLEQARTERSHVFRSFLLLPRPDFLFHPPVHIDGAGPWCRPSDHPANHLSPVSLLRYSLVHTCLPSFVSIC